MSGGGNSAIRVQLAHIHKYIKKKCKLDFSVSFLRLKVFHSPGKTGVTGEQSTLQSGVSKAEESRPRQTLGSLGRSLGRDLLRTVVTVNGPVLPFLFL